MNVGAAAIPKGSAAAIDPTTVAEPHTPAGAIINGPAAPYHPNAACRGHQDADDCERSTKDSK